MVTNSKITIEFYQYLYDEYGNRMENRELVDTYTCKVFWDGKIEKYKLRYSNDQDSHPLELAKVYTNNTTLFNRIRNNMELVSIKRRAKRLAEEINYHVVDAEENAKFVTGGAIMVKRGAA